jgi:hypothetical protein
VVTSALTKAAVPPVQLEIALPIGPVIISMVGIAFSGEPNKHFQSVRVLVVLEVGTFPQSRTPTHTIEPLPVQHEPMQPIADQKIHDQHCEHRDYNSKAVDWRRQYD